MAAKKTGISRDLVIHPGETIADVLEDRGITQAESVRPIMGFSGMIIPSKNHI